MGLTCVEDICVRGLDLRVCVCVCFRGCKYSTRRLRKNLRAGEKNKWMNSEKKCHSRGGLEDNKHKNH